MNTKQADKQASIESKTLGARYVVWVFDEGRDVYSREQVKTYGAFLTIEALFINGAKVADAAIAIEVAA
jgi:hypothetical protein